MNPHFEHQDWLGTERMRTKYDGSVESTFTSLPFGDAQTPPLDSNGDASHYATFDHDSESNTDHAEFRQYSNTQGRWLSPDPYSGSYDAGNPQSFNRYAYAGNSPLANIDPSGLMMCDSNGCIFGDEGGDCDPDFGDCGGCDPIFYDCWGVGGWAGPISSPQPEFKGYKDLDPNNVMNEHLGLPPGMQLPTGGLLDIFGIYVPGCEFGACGGGSDFMRGGSSDSFHAYHCSMFGPCYMLPRNGFPRRFFGTRWCGPGGAGSPVSDVDRACRAHDICFGLAGLDARANTDSSVHLSLAQAVAAQGCNQQLYNSVSQYPNEAGSSRIQWWLKYGTYVGVLTPGTGVQ